MKIITKDFPTIYHVKDVNPGDCFLWMGEYCYKIEEIIDQDGSSINAISLEYCRLLYLDEFEVVDKIYNKAILTNE